MLSISNLSIHFAGRYLFDNVNFTIGTGDRIGLIGRNGTGKSTLLKIIFGLETPEEGNVSRPNGFQTGYLPQEGHLQSEESIFDEVLNSLSVLKDIENEINTISVDIEKRSDYDSPEYARMLDRLTELNERFTILGGASIEADIEKVLTGLGFEREDFSRTVNEFSGGWRMRVELSKILLSRPDLILLDEPTNHLDIESIRWLEGFLRNYPGSLILVSHDRRFLNHVTNRTIEISKGKIYDNKLSFDKFMLWRQEQRENQLSAFKNQQMKIKQTERFIERFRSKATLATRVQSRIKQLDKIERIEVEEEDHSGIRFTFPEAPRSGRVLVEMEGLTKKYGDKLVLEKINLALERDEKVAFIGKNGEGKTTLSKIIAGELDYEGNFKLGHNAMLGYYAQHVAEMLAGESTVFQTIDDIATGDMRTRVRSLLGAFLFRGEEIYKKVKVLSGGEKSRLALAKLLLQPINLLILDEPTNHLDMAAKEVLKNALLDYKGGMIIVSHDRDFLHGLTNKTVEFKKKKIIEYPGDINEYLEKKKLESLAELEEQTKTEKENKKSTTKPGNAKLEREQQKAVQREKSRLSRLVRLCEEEIASIEESISALEQLFSDPEFFTDPVESKKKKDEYDNLRKKLSEKEDEWANLLEELEGVG